MSDHEILSLVHAAWQAPGLTVQESQQFFRAVVSGEVDDVLLAAVIASMKVRQPRVAELTGAAQALLASATEFPRPDYLFADVVGTGGDGHNTINLSTMAALVAACCGAKIIKHGNRSISSVSGSFDLLESLGLPFDTPATESRRLVDRHDICFLYAPNYHAGLRHAASVRRRLKARTIFNLLGPLVNPARPPLMLLGVAETGLRLPIATVLSQLGCEAAFVVHGSGVDEMAIHGPTEVTEVKRGEIIEYQLTPSDFGSREWKLEELVCDQAAQSHRRAAAILRGDGSPAENAAVCINAAMVLKLFGQHDLPVNFARANEVLRRGQPMLRVQQITGGAHE